MEIETEGSSKVLNEEGLEFLEDPEVTEGPVTQTVITHNATYQANDLDAYDSDCDDFSTAKVVLMANLSSYGLDALSEPQNIESNKEVRPLGILSLVETKGSSKVLNEEGLEFFPEVTEGPVTQTVITHNATYQANDLDAYDSDCDDFSTAKAVLMANLSSYGLDALSEVPHYKITHIDMLNQSVQEM
uniref:Uncharacterized protein n=1 Tax=Tanacetum cinerariifolium TaxID=118510 RepID=A0A699KPH7_TANCI|nr:hypothetical protein [Tanacetum cinerariifolium]